jgi:hypothetical protein
LDHSFPYLLLLRATHSPEDHRYLDRAPYRASFFGIATNCPLSATLWQTYKESSN